MSRLPRKGSRWVSNVMGSDSLESVIIIKWQVKIINLIIYDELLGGDFR